MNNFLTQYENDQSYSGVINEFHKLHLGCSRLAADFSILSSIFFLFMYWTFSDSTVCLRMPFRSLLIAYFNVNIGQSVVNCSNVHTHGRPDTAGLIRHESHDLER